MGGVCKIDIHRGYPVLHNDPTITEAVRQFAKEYLGDENVVELPLRMTSEDFAYYSQVIPAAFYRLGTGNKARGITSALHTTTFDIDEDSLETSIGLMAWVAIKMLG
jgi:metal-dependent amidase/aminoacylase/carboxypeptidase family protein